MSLFQLWPNILGLTIGTALYQLWQPRFSWTNAIGGWVTGVVLWFAVAGGWTLIQSWRAR